MRSLAAAVLLLVVTATWTIPLFDTLLHGSEIYAVYAAILLLLLPATLAFALLVLGSLIFAALTWIDRVKIDLTHLPLTFTDLRISVGNLSGLAVAMGLPHATVLEVYAAAALVVSALLGLALHAWHRRRKAERPQRPLAPLVALTVLWSISIGLFTGLTGTRLADAANSAPDFWGPEGVAMFSERVGLVPFLVATHQLDAASRAAFTDSLPEGGASLDPIPIRRFVTPAQTGDDLLPNIVLIQAESTFDPNKAFHLREPYRNALLERHPLTAAQGSLKVIPIGGGSWVSEFESVTGLDSRFFGYFGYYTHSSLSTYVRRGFASYLRDKGYSTYVFYSWPGEFFNARNAYRHYGFQTFLDSHDLGKGDGSGGTDTQMVDDFIARLDQDQSHPFFAFIPTSENHAPHDCKNFKSTEEMFTTLAGTDQFEINCELNEYMLRMVNTAAAFDTARDFLERLRLQTGRPFVLALYGDHQPHTVTGTDAAKFDFTPYRTRDSIQHTVFKIDSSLPNVFDIPTPFPLTLMPTLLSAYVARDLDDLYLPFNLQLFDACGADFFVGAVSYETVATGSVSSQKGSAQCALMRDRAIEEYRRAGAL
ncbi:hypothetical protein K32_13030 [Kaistia sp. 32K]|uniref:sulfatase-like hydrolase/transferase n=1 Tax=Kaistia sp. 32K TaxID=2795690 RepID=UPI0019165F15|nr:sulfatase-like hydrolase/transferase [Kaistia sp. 32K]BCP52686.1 hypothetical protein K32_13030 [Kaistia sp. 32K]